MDYDNEFYKQWNIKLRKNHQLFIEKSDLPIKKLLQTNKIYSSTILDDQTESESFSLRLSESCTDDTYENSKSKQNKINEIIVISDSSSNESIFSDVSSKLVNNKYIKMQIPENTNISKSVDESCSTSVQQTIFNRIQNMNFVSNIKFNEDNRKGVIIEESDSEIEQNRVPQSIEEIVIPNKISENKEKEIIKWLLTNFHNFKHSSSYSQESIISNSRKSSINSGNSSLERLELNFETPNNRGKLSNPKNVTKFNKIIQKESEKQTTLDQYFTKSKNIQLNVVKDKICKGNNSKILTKSESKDFNSDKRKNFDKIPINIKINPKKLFVNTSESKTSNSKIFINESSDEALLNNIKPDFDKKFIFVDQSESSDSDMSKKNIKTNSKNTLIPESVSFDSNTPENTCDIKKMQTNIKMNSKKIISESESVTSKTLESNNSIISLSNYFKFADHIDGLNTINLNDKIQVPPNVPLKEISKSIDLQYNNNAENLSSFSDLKLKNEMSNKKNVSSISATTFNSTINDCADILENLYGKTWRDKAATLISNEPKNVETKENIRFRLHNYKLKSKNNVSGIENSYKSTIRLDKTLQKSKNRNHLKNSFINDDSTIESSPDCSYYTALSNPIIPQNNQLNTITSSTIKKNKIKQKNIFQIYDSESDIDENNWKNVANQIKLNFTSNSSSTSEFDPDDIVPPRIHSKCNKIKKSIKSKTTSQADDKNLEKDTERRFLASLSKTVPLENANFKAMVYRVKYNIMKEELCKVLFKLFNEHVFNNQLPNDMLIEWSTRLRGTAGKCYNKQSLKAFNKTVRSSRIVLATKILDSPDRLRDTLIHEMCHAATWLINNISDGHGSFWKAWANKAKKVFPELPPISRCHNYEIHTKYTYKCTTCGYNIGRHSKSLDLDRKRCGYCHGKFELLINKVTKTGKIQKKSLIQTKEPTGFALYVKENYQLVKQTRNAIKHGEIMKILGKQFSAIKITQKSDDSIKNYENDLA